MTGAVVCVSGVFVVFVMCLWCVCGEAINGDGAMTVAMVMVMAMTMAMTMTMVMSVKK